VTFIVFQEDRKYNCLKFKKCNSTHQSFTWGTRCSLGLFTGQTSSHLRTLCNFVKS